MQKNQNYVIWIQKLYSLHKNVIFIKMIFIKTLKKMLKQDLILQTMNNIDHYLKEKTKVIGLVKDELGGKIMKEFVGLRAKTYVTQQMMVVKTKMQHHKQVCHRKKT